MSTKHTKILWIALGFAVGALVLFVFVRFLLPWLSPFFVSVAVAMLLNPVVSFLCSRLRFPRSLASLLCVIGFFALSASLLWAAAGRVFAELQAFSAHLPNAIAAAGETLARAQAWFFSFAARAPDGLEAYIHAAAMGMMDELMALPAVLTGKIVPMAAALASATPEIMLFTVTAVIGAYFISASFFEIKDFVLLQIPQRLRSRARAILADLKSSLGHYLKAQLLLTLITFGELVVAFTLLRVHYALSLAIFTAVVDALPVLGTGTVLVPWAAYCFITGDVPMGVGLLISYGAVTILRNMIQAKLLGDELGLHPLFTLLSIYVGFKAFGVLGMMICPIVAIMLKKLNDAGMIRLWKDLPQ